MKIEDDVFFPGSSVPKRCRECAHAYYVYGVEFECTRANSGKRCRFKKKVEKNERTAKMKEKEESDTINHPAHYGAAFPPVEIECIRITRYLPFTVGNAFKYIWRAGRKDPEKTLEDLRKALWYVHYARRCETDLRYPAARAVFGLIPEDGSLRWFALRCIVHGSFALAGKYIRMWIGELENDED